MSRYAPPLPLVLSLILFFFSPSSIFPIPGSLISFSFTILPLPPASLPFHISFYFFLYLTFTQYQHVSLTSETRVCIFGAYLILIKCGKRITLTVTIYRRTFLASWRPVNHPSKLLIYIVTISLRFRRFTAGTPYFEGCIAMVSHQGSLMLSYPIVLISLPTRDSLAIEHTSKACLDSDRLWSPLQLMWKAHTWKLFLARDAISMPLSSLGMLKQTLLGELRNREFANAICIQDPG